MSPARVPHDGDRGWIIPIGGAEDKISSVGILRRFTELAGGAAARIAIIPTASTQGDTGSRYESLFRSLGVAEARALPYLQRADAERAEWMTILQAATGIFLTGGNHLRLSTILGGPRSRARSAGRTRRASTSPAPVRAPRSCAST